MADLAKGASDVLLFHSKEPNSPIFFIYIHAQTNRFAYMWKEFGCLQWGCRYHWDVVQVFLHIFANWLNPYENNMFNNLHRGSRMDFIYFLVRVLWCPKLCLIPRCNNSESLCFPLLLSAQNYSFLWVAKLRTSVLSLLSLCKSVIVHSPQS